LTEYFIWKWTNFGDRSLLLKLKVASFQYLSGDPSMVRSWSPEHGFSRHTMPPVAETSFNKRPKPFRKPGHSGSIQRRTKHVPHIRDKTTTTA